MMIILMLLFGIVPTLWLPLVVIPLILAFLLASGLGFWLCSVSAKYRDVRIIVPFFVQLMLFVTPIIYPPSYLTGSLSFINTINPLAAIINAQRGFALGTGISDWLPLGYAAVVSILFFLGGLIYFSRYERKIADVV
jgi:lipopolysaccharide transport system permease protein